jgi:flagellar hook-length control protein FliK
METTSFDIRPSLNAKAGLALGKAPAESTTTEGQPDGNSPFAGMLGQKISEVALSGSKPAPSTASQGGKRPLHSVLKGMASIGKSESTANGKAKPVADHHHCLSTCNNEPLNGITGEIAPVTGSMAEISPSLTEEKAEPAEDATIAIDAAEEGLEHAMARAATGESIPDADSSLPEDTARPIPSTHLPDMALFTQAVQPREAKPLEIDMDASLAKKAVRKESPASASPEPLPRSDRPADHPSAREGEEVVTEPAFMQQVDETMQRKNSRSAAGTALDVHEPSLSLHNHGKPAEASKELASIATTSRKPTSEEAAPNLPQPGPAAPDNGKRAGSTREVASLIAAPQKPVSAVHDQEPALQRVTPAGSPEKTLQAGEVMAETTGPARDRQHRNTTDSHSVRNPERDIFPFRVEMQNTATPQGTNAPVAAGPAGIEMQAVIDQLLEARQAAGNDSGRIRILLTPPNLGTVDLDIVVRGERVEVVMTAENASVQQALQSRGDDIRIALQRQDLKIEGFQVLLQDNGTGQQQTHSDAMYRQNREHQEGFNTGKDAAPALQVLSPIAGATSAAGRVSIFA